MDLDKYTKNIEKIYNEELSFGNIDLGDEFVINVYNSEGTLPHFHYKSKDGRQGCIRLDVPRYFCHENYHDGLNTKNRKKLVFFITKDLWISMVNEWNRGRTTNLINTTEMPNYNLLPNLNSTTGKLNKEDRK